ncbi:16S rRNA (cytosine(967)-C(5))-methyltransferase [Funiculus sociatus GB2-A5]|uniref:16S rRNA (Cytosine(967)-C(5))-methyltransferase n=1 Tax=Funiculus sociatus GB2-A5 TaxID=2933946 RepID=A0ABV0JJV0_9CYAN|nr:16S rRNA (cytosine(967)-C(5))-methyltransferase [Trichocoleus sp. FACHB-6]
MEQNPRQIAFIALRDVHRGAFADVALDRVLRKADLSAPDRRLVTELVYGSVRRVRSLDFLIDRLGKKKSHQQPPDLRSILHLGLYQLAYLSQIPAWAAVNTTVELAKENGFSGLSRFVNGLLRQYIRLVETNAIASLELPENPIQHLGILHSYPDWIIEAWLNELGKTETEQLCQWLNQPPTIDLRINTLCTSIEEVEAAMQAASVGVTRVPYLPQALRLTNTKAEERGDAGTPGLGTGGWGLGEESSRVPNPQSPIPNPQSPIPNPQSRIPNSQSPIPNPKSKIEKLPGFSEGWWTVQDSSAQLVSYLLDPQPGEVVIDACAAPGGKTTHIAELMGDNGAVWACDKTASRLRKLKENAERLGLQSIQIQLGDSRSLTQFINTGDRVLLDAPCSGLGTLHRHADARWRQTPDTVRELSQLQGELLDQVATWVKPGGILVYATCTLHPLENEGVIHSFLERHQEWQISPPNPNSPFSAFSTPAGWIKVWPHRHQMDGFFMVRLQQKH